MAAGDYYDTKQPRQLDHTPPKDSVPSAQSTLLEGQCWNDAESAALDPNFNMQLQM